MILLFSFLLLQPVSLVQPLFNGFFQQGSLFGTSACAPPHNLALLKQQLWNHFSKTLKPERPKLDLGEYQMTGKDEVYPLPQ
jgi:hypothetical protein